jgi:hypothetical protein
VAQTFLTKRPGHYSPKWFSERRITSTFAGVVFATFLLIRPSGSTAAP